eukprot:CAMPEP_0169385802 /NCGR_PEP_ID=MMETSP1017-20121227/44311_1 /TAXON_ID=342587 /ORGANISM="Karlodinium micrum, Strain CCMP2283" /LENGTH=205 /DNA_ID=CAMNT_0009486763 /DNA_START=222 /DNA_END=835 /DNA_ORIENTATION=+
MPAPHTDAAEPPTGMWTMDGARPDPHRPPPMPAPLVERLAEAEHAATPLLLAAQLGLALRPVSMRAYLARDNLALHIAASKGDLGVVKVLMNSTSGNVNLSPVDAANLVPLHLACHSGHTLVAQTLLGANVDASLLQLALLVASSCGRYPLDIETGPPGASSSYLGIVTALLDAKADPTISGPLQAAGVAGDIAVVSELVQRGGN